MKNNKNNVGGTSKSLQNTFLFKNPRQLKHKGNHFRATGEGIKSFHLYRWEKYPAQIEQTSQDMLQEINRIVKRIQKTGKIRTILSRFWSEKCIVGPNLSKALLYDFKYFFMITNDVSGIPKTFLMILHRFERFYGTSWPRSHLVRDTLHLARESYFCDFSTYGVPLSELISTTKSRIDLKKNDFETP